MRGLVILADDLAETGVHLCSLTQGIDTSSPTGGILIGLFAALASLEREVLVERTLSGLESARAWGRVGGRPTVLPAERLAAARARGSRHPQGGGRPNARRGPVHALPRARPRRRLTLRLTPAPRPCSAAPAAVHTPTTRRRHERPRLTDPHRRAYSVSHVRFAGGDETPRFECHLRRDGAHVSVVSNGGEGGCHHYRPTIAAGWAAIREFERYAEERGAACGVQYEPNDALVYELLERWATEAYLEPHR